MLEHAPSDPEAGNVVSFEISSLKPDTGYSYVLEVNGRPEPAKQGKFRTFPSGAASFRMAFASCARTGSTSEVFDRIREARPLFYMTLSTGIGGGILGEHGVWRGADSYAGELGHMTIRVDGPGCLCGARGCFERLCCGLWLERDHGRPAQELLKNPAFVERYVVDLALGLKSVLMLLNPARIVIGGGISKAGDALFVPLRAELGRRMTAWSRARIDVVPASLGDDSVLYGALELSRESGK